MKKIFAALLSLLIATPAFAGPPLRVVEANYTVTPANGQFLGFDGTYWHPANLPTATPTNTPTNTPIPPTPTPTNTPTSTPTPTPTFTPIGGTGTGLVAKTGAGSSYATRTLTGPTAGISVSNGDGVAGNPTLSLSNDLSAVEGLSGTGLAVRTGTDAWTNRSLTAPAAGLTISSNDGVAGNPTFALANDLAALEAMSGTGIVARTASETYAQRTISTDNFNDLFWTNGDGISGNPSIRFGTDFKENTVRGGWVPFDAAGLTRSSSNVFNTNIDYRSYVGIGDKIVAPTTGGTKYFYVTAISSSQITVVGDTIPAGIVGDAYWSHDVSPIGFPTWFGWTPTLTASGSMTFTSTSIATAAFAMYGRTVLFIVNVGGTTGGSASTELRFSLPVTASNQQPGIAGQVFDGSGTIAGCIILVDTTHFGATRYDGANFGLGASRGFRAAGFYEVP